ncbi:MAG TPA: hypothetical protein DC058_13875, partial [Planctomycetaceae bacterium]|nr:hypothetical protein [Planctomycetaceae bacterium]
MRSMLMCLALLVLNCCRVAAADPTQLPVWQDRVVEGWTLHISQRLLDEDAEATTRAVELLTL